MRFDALEILEQVVIEGPELAGRLGLDAGDLRTRRLGGAAHGQRRVGRGRQQLDERLIVLGRR